MSYQPRGSLYIFINYLFYSVFLLFITCFPFCLVTGTGASNMVNQINETMDIKDPSLVWQQSGQYLPDSGIQSGGSTQTHSITTKEDDMERDRLLFDLDQGFPQSFPHEQVDGI